MADLSFYRSADPFARVQRQAIFLLVPLVATAVVATHWLSELAGATQTLAAPALTAFLCLAGATAILAGLRPAHHPHDRLGPANGITFTRAAVVAAMAGLMATPTLAVGPGALAWSLVAMAGLVLLLDGIDGWAARRSGLASRFGARLDVETDVAFALVMAGLAISAEKVGFWFLALGLLRPMFLFAAHFFRCLRADLPHSQRRRMVAGLQMGAQVAILAPIVSPLVSTVLGAGVLTLVVWSFTVDIRALLSGNERAA